MYSASILDLAKVGCIFDFQESKVSFPKIAHAVTDVLVSGL